MSCGNRFQCGITRFQKHSFTPDKPSNQELHNENKKRLSDLLKAREDIDKQFFASNTKLSETSAMTIHRPDEKTNELLNNIKPATNNTNYTPWTVPQGQYSAFNSK